MLKGGVFEVNFIIAEVDEGNEDDAVIAASSSHHDRVKNSDIKMGGSGKNRKLSIKFGAERGAVKITVVIQDKLKQSSAPVVLNLELSRWVGVDTKGLYAYWSFNNQNDPQNSDFGGFKASKQGGATACHSPADSGRSRGKTGNSACFNNQEHRHFAFTIGSHPTIKSNVQFTLSVWMYHNTCYNNQIPLTFYKSGRMINFIDGHALAYWNFNNWLAYRGHHSGSSCENMKNKWNHHLYVGACLYATTNKTCAHSYHTGPGWLVGASKTSTACQPSHSLTQSHTQTSAHFDSVKY